MSVNDEIIAADRKREESMGSIVSQLIRSYLATRAGRQDPAAVQTKPGSVMAGVRIVNPFHK